VLASCRIMFLAILICVIATAPLIAQQPRRGACDIPAVSASSKKAAGGPQSPSVTPNVSVADFDVSLAGHKTALLAAALDESPKRIICVVDASKAIGEKEWELEMQRVRLLSEHARSADRFALVVMSALGGTHDFSAPEEFLERLGLLESAPPSPAEKGSKVYDALQAAIALFDPPHFGDAIFILSRGEDRGSHTNLTQIRNLL
jgi:hypothetical protein